jgi:hypothetical protein
MRKINSLLRGLVGVVILSSFAMCKKNEIVKPATSMSDTTTAVTGSAADVKRINATATTIVTVQPSQWYIDGATIPAGSVIYIPAGTRGALLLKNLKGTAAQPIIVVNKGGRVTFLVSTSASYAFKAQNCRYFKILGNGVPSVAYGFDVNGGNISMTMDDLSSDFEIANVEVHNSAFAGIMAKTDPSCDVATQRDHFTMTNVSIHNNYVHRTGGEGFYVGNSFYASGRSLSCGTVLPHSLSNVKIYKNVVDSTGCEGIQVGGAISGCEIYSNTVVSPGMAPFASDQNNGIQIGEGTGGKCYGNIIKNAPGNGIIVLGLGDNLLFNNIIVNARGNGIFADSRYTPGPYFRFINNTIIAPALDGIKLNSETIPMNVAINNVIIKPGSGLAIHTKSTAVKLTASNNYINTDINTCKFINYSSDNYHLSSSSPLINNGANALAYGINVDYYGTARPSAGSFDIGATEY